MTATLTLGHVTDKSVTVNFSFTSQSPQITKVSCFCEEHNPTGTVYTSRQFTFSATSSYSNSITWSGLTTNRQHKLYVRSYDANGNTVETTNILYPTTATTISLSSSGSGSRSASIDTGGNIDHYKITPSSSGNYTIYCESGIDTYGYLFDSSGTQLTSDDDSGTDSNFSMTYYLSASTTYYIRVKAYNTTTTGSYTVYVEKESSSSTTDDHSNTSSGATTISMSSSGVGSVSGSIETSGDVDYFKFTVPSGKGGTYWIYTTGSLDTKGWLYDSSQTELNYNDDNTTMGGSNNFGIEHTLTASRTYYVKVGAYSTNTGSYTLNIARQVVDDYGDNASSAYTITLASAGNTKTLSGSIEESADVDYFKFTPTISGTYKFYTSGSLDTIGTLYNSSNTQLTTNDDDSSNIGSGGRNFAFTYTLTANTTYYLKVGAYSNNTGDYTLNIVTPNSLPSDMSLLTQGNTTSNSIQILWSASSNTTNYCLEVYLAGTTTLVYSDYEIASDQTSYTITGLTANTAYDIKMYPKNANGNGNYSKLLSAKTTTGLPNAMGTLTTGTITPNSIQVKWSSVTGATSYALEVYHTATGTLVHSDYSIASNQTSYIINGLSNYVNYTIKMYPKNSYGNGSSSTIAVSTTNGLPSAPTNFTATSLTNGFNTSWSSVTNATSYSIESYHADTNVLIYSEYGITSTTHQITGLNSYVTYNLKLWAVNQYGYSTAVWLNGQRTKDGIPPTIHFNDSSGEGKVYVSWSAVDEQSGLRPQSTYSVYIGTANGAESTMKHVEYTTNTYYTFISDANGNEFVHGAKYWVRVYAYDIEANVGMTTAQITYYRTRPNNWNWWTDKVQGQPIGLQADEWNSFCTRVNQFRQYKKLDNYTFTEVTKGSTITASAMNQAVNAINAMVTTKLSTVAVGQLITASFYNQLRDKLNSIT